MLGSDGGEGGQGDSDVGGGDDIIVGDALATGAVDAGGLGGTATANNKAGVTGSSDAYVWAEAGSDFIDGGEGNNLLVGDAATTDENGGNATANNEASVDGAEGSAGAGNDDIVWEGRSEEHTSELQSLMRSSYAVFCLKKKTIHMN